MPPEIRAPLETLGAWSAFVRDGHAVSPGNIASWGTDVPRENDFIFNPYGSGWHVDRRRFDAMLAGTAEVFGATVHRSARATSCHRSRDGWVIEALRDGERREFRARFLVDAMGRRSASTKWADARRIVHDRLVAIVAFSTRSVGGAGADPRTLVESVETGWWYSAPLPEGTMVTAFMTDWDLLRSDVTGIRNRWNEEMQKAPHTRGHLRSLAPPERLRIVPANTSELVCASGEGWIAVGDAATSFDPLSSEGIFHALESGIRAARSILNMPQVAGALASDYAQWTRTVVERYLQTRKTYYQVEHRWPRSSFWQRRQH